MKTLFSVVFAIVVAGTTLLSAQVSPESEKLNYFAGTWKLEIHLRESPVSGKVFFETERNEWLPGRSLLLSRPEETTAFGAGIVVMAYDPKAKAYTYHQIKSTGEEQDLFGTFKDGLWTWTGNETAQDSKTFKTRFVMKEVSKTCYSLVLESAKDGQNWAVVMEGIATKIVPRAHQDVAFLR
jgi:hypothetical protein